MAENEWEKLRSSGNKGTLGQVDEGFFVLHDVLQLGTEGQTGSDKERQYNIWFSKLWLFTSRKLFKYMSTGTLTLKTLFSTRKIYFQQINRHLNLKRIEIEI